jgi:hypothetical protein
MMVNTDVTDWRPIAGAGESEFSQTWWESPVASRSFTLRHTLTAADVAAIRAGGGIAINALASHNGNPIAPGDMDFTIYTITIRR